MEYPVTGALDPVEVPCLKKYKPLSPQYSACVQLALKAQRSEMAKDAAQSLVSGTKDSFGEDAKRSAVASMLTMMGAVTWAWTTPMFNPKVAEVKGSQGTGKDAVCDGPEATTRVGLVGDKCYQPVTPIRSIQRDFDPIIAGLMVLAILIGCAKVSIQLRGDGLVDIARAIATTIVVAGLLAIVVQVVLSITDSLAISLMAGAPGPNDPGLQNVAAMGEVMKSPEFGGIGLVGMLVMSFLVIFAAVAQIAMMILRMAVIPALVVFAPIAASTSSTRIGSQWLQKTLMYLLAFVIYKPVAAATYVLGLRMLAFAGSSEQLKGPQGEVAAIVQVIGAGVLMFLTVALMPVLLKFLVPVAGAGMSSMFSGAAVAGGVATGAVALGSMASAGGSSAASGAGMASSGAASGGRMMAGAAAGGGVSAGGSGSVSGTGPAGSGGGAPSGAASVPPETGSEAKGAQGAGASSDPGASDGGGELSGSGPRPELESGTGAGDGSAVEPSPARPMSGSGSAGGSEPSGSAPPAGVTGTGSRGSGASSGSEPAAAGSSAPATAPGTTPAGTAPVGAAPAGGRQGVPSSLVRGAAPVVPQVQGARMMGEESGRG
ncbi:hypothetical protein [Enemella dayhoffiae]|uniref:hypothetical protein n=1 Tax=Enemella dayhoffiae TaxID=2016507 RepID=UPI0011408600|nr:hypothetical protein [Enemella dayhoffiae]